MTERERIEALLRREKPDRIPIWPMASASGFSAIYSQVSIADVYNRPEIALAVQRNTSKEFGWAIVPMLGYASYGSWEFGGEIKWPSSEFSQAPMVVKRPVENEEDVFKLKKPDITRAGIVPIQVEFYKLAAMEHPDNEPFNIMAFIGGPFTAASNICGTENLAKWLIRKPDVVHHLMRLVTGHLMELVEYLSSLFGTETVLPFCGEAVTDNRLVSPRHFEQFVLPYLKELHQKIISVGYEHLFCHICGEQNANLPQWAQVPMGDPGIISIGHEVELSTAAEYFPNDIIMGNLEPVIIQENTPDEVYGKTRRVIEAGMKLTGGYIFSPGCGTPPLSPVENIRAITKAVNDFGWYK